MLVLFHDYASPASWVAVSRLQRLADEGLPVAFEGIEVGGLDVALPPTLQVLAELDAVRDDAAAAGLAPSRPPLVPPTARAHVVGDVADEAGLGASWRAACYAALWHDGLDISRPEVLADVAAGAGLDVAAVTEALAQPGAVLRIRQRAAARRRDGVGGVPVLLAHGTLVPGLLSEADLRALT